jgi:hypothetical protein
MPKNPKETSPRVAKVASKQLKDPSASKPAKTTAGSALSQAALKKKPK